MKKKKNPQKWIETYCTVLHLTLSAAPPEPEDGSKQGVSMSATPVYSELWFILLLALLGLFLLAILLGLVLQRYCPARVLW